MPPFTRTCAILVTAPLLLLSCGSGGSGGAPQSPPPDPGTTPAATGVNFQVDAAAIPSSIQFTSEDFSASDCEVQEGCVTGTGTRKLMLFEGDIMNVGTSDFVLGDPATSPYFKWSPCHQHYHLQDIMLFELVQPSTGQVVTAGSAPVVARKQGFCMEDSQPIVSNPGSPKYDCNNQGLTAGWEDIYDNSLPCQWLDITNVPPGDYLLRITVNPDKLYPETDYNDNVAITPVTIGP